MSQGPYQSPQGYGMSGLAPPRSGAVTAAAVLNFIFGGLHILCGGLMGLALAAIAADEAEFIRAMKEEYGEVPPLEFANWAEFLDFVRLIMQVMAVIGIIAGILAIVAGIGVIRRAGWGRVLALIVAVISFVLGGLVGFGAVQQPDPLAWATAFLYAGFGVVVFVLLLGGGAAADFRARQMASMGLPYGGGQFGAGGYGGSQGWNNPQPPGGPGQPPYGR